MRMVVRVHEARHDKVATGLDDLHAVRRRDGRCDALDLVAAYQKIGDRGLVDVAVMIVDAPAADQIARGSIGPRHLKSSKGAILSPGGDLQCPGLRRAGIWHRMCLQL